jgi:ferredoxin
MAVCYRPICSVCAITREVIRVDKETGPEKCILCGGLAGFNLLIKVDSNDIPRISKES